MKHATAAVEVHDSLAGGELSPAASSCQAQQHPAWSACAGQASGSGRPAGQAWGDEMAAGGGTAACSVSVDDVNNHAAALLDAS